MSLNPQYVKIEFAEIAFIGQQEVKFEREIADDCPSDEFAELWKHSNLIALCLRPSVAGFDVAPGNTGHYALIKGIASDLLWGSVLGNAYWENF